MIFNALMLKDSPEQIAKRYDASLEEIQRIRKDSASELASVSKGSFVRVACSCAGKLGNVILRDCRLR